MLLDEWHRVFAIWDAVRRMVDEDPSGGRFLLTGSPPTSGTHSGAGRIATIAMRPLSVYERGLVEPTVSLRSLIDGGRPPVAGRSTVTLADYTREVVAGGFPALRGLPDDARQAQLTGYCERIIDHDLPEAGRSVRRPATVRAWLRAYAAATATTTRRESIRDAATPGDGTKPTRATTEAYTELLKGMRILDPLEAWSPGRNQLANLTLGEKHYLADPALAAVLLNRNERSLLGPSHDEDDLRDGPLLGRLFESLAVLSIRAIAQSVGGKSFHLRSRNGRHEIDLVIETGNGIVAIEVKLGVAVDDHDARHLHWLANQIGNDLVESVVVTTGPEAYRRPDGVAVVPLALLGP